ncbi:DUF4831 family protein [Prevotella sp. OH937_COT-195]|uniref:DUF4831 family protein n=1 Tax=Prevotella sp. OH937_COT-195 TaxID=2491051 RepID=UPI000F64C50E|nr:DUF4831 family protein [Prevotella sp. OH937_COT-195]RRD02105.1 DUF4831 family protein [Prevotella sp. OH937_COT-195]
MNKFIAATAFAIVLMTAAMAKTQQIIQTQEGYSYFLPKTSLRLSVLVEKTTVTPGELCIYAGRYLKKNDAPQTKSEHYKIVSISMATEAVRDTARYFVLQADAKHCINHAEIDRNGILTAINTEGKTVKDFVPFEKQTAIPRQDPRKFLNQEILAAASKAKMAELTAHEIYDIRDSRNELTRGKAEFMPKDGEQLRIMLQQLDTQERALLQMFCGTTTRDTTQTVIRYVPTEEVNDLILFRFSEKLGILDADDLAGSPYYIDIENLKEQMPEPEIPIGNIKPDKDDIGLRVTVPGRVRATIHTLSDKYTVTPYEFWAAQFGTLINLSGELFNKKIRAELILDPTTGAVEHIKTELLKK